MDLLVAVGVTAFVIGIPVLAIGVETNRPMLRVLGAVLSVAPFAMVLIGGLIYLWSAALS